MENNMFTITFHTGLYSIPSYEKEVEIYPKFSHPTNVFNFRDIDNIITGIFSLIKYQIANEYYTQSLDVLRAINNTVDNYPYIKVEIHRHNKDGTITIFSRKDLQIALRDNIEIR